MMAVGFVPPGRPGTSLGLMEFEFVEILGSFGVA